MSREAHAPFCERPGVRFPRSTLPGDLIPLSGSNLGILSLAFLLAQTTTNLLWGWLADRAGFRRVFILALVTWIGSVFLLLQCTEIWPLAASFFGIGAGLGGFMLSAQNLVLEFGVREDLPMRIAVANSSSELVGAIGPLLGGFLALAFSYSVVFWVAAAFQLTALMMILLFVAEPRHRRVSY